MTVKLKRMTSRDRPLVVIAALDQEARALAHMLEPSERPSPGLSMWEGDGVALILSGVGKVAAAAAAQYACDSLSPRALLSIGLAGGVNSRSQPGRVIVASGALQHDVDARPLTMSRGELAALATIVIEADQDLCERLMAAAGGVVDDRALVRTGLVLTGDQIIAARDLRDSILRDFPDGACFDMETAAVAQVAQINRLPWGGVRITSDSADESFNVDAVLGFGARTASELFARIVGVLLEEDGAA